MDARGARLLRARIAAGASGARVEVVAVHDGHPSLRLGTRVTVLSFEEAGVRIELDSGDTLVVDPLSVELRAVRPGS